MTPQKPSRTSFEVNYITLTLQKKITKGKKIKIKK